MFLMVVFITPTNQFKMRIRLEDNTKCPYCQAEQTNLYGSGTDCSSCGNYMRIGMTTLGFISLYRHTNHLKYRVIRREYKEQCEAISSYFNLDNSYFKKTSNKVMRNCVVRYAHRIGMKPYKIEKFHRENGSKLSFATIVKIINNAE
jgi:hypothetical protein